jgi:ribonucleoside-diphosphate reductase alpha chain
MCTIHTSKEIVNIYGEGSLFASGVIVDGLRAFDNNLWAACDAVNGLGTPIEEENEEATCYTQKINELLDEIQKNELKENWSGRAIKLASGVSEVNKNNLKRDWIRRAKQFANRYFENDIKKMSHCLKEVHNWKLWQDLQREYKDVDYSNFIEGEDNTKANEEWACSGPNGCEVSFVKK